ncbi:MAG: glycosyltransferase [Bacteroidota bacterium]|nr:glycosyltransferase [Bacteroidota bacterium]
MITWLVFLFLACNIAVVAGTACWILFNPPKKFDITQTLPKISILVAARNEENNILRCMQALSLLDYPKNLLEIWIGNDDSTDRTAQIIRDFCRDNPEINFVDIKENIGLARGKANVLAHLANKATGGYFFITDADIAVNSQWITALLPALMNGYAMASGTTIVKGKSFLNQMECMDWMQLMAYYHLFDRFLGITCNGNNMAISAAAYRATGGYEKIPFSVTEDYSLYLILSKKGEKHIQMMNKDVLGESMPTESFASFLDQRRRWLVGAKNQPWHRWITFPVYSLFLPVLIWLFILNWQLGSLVFCIKLLTQTFLLGATARRVGTSIDLWKILPFELFLYTTNLLVFVNFFLPGPVRWKDRKF